MGESSSPLGPANLLISLRKSENTCFKPEQSVINWLNHAATAAKQPRGGLSLLRVSADNYIPLPKGGHRTRRLRGCRMPAATSAEAKALIEPAGETRGISATRFIRFCATTLMFPAAFSPMKFWVPSPCSRAVLLYPPQ